MRESIQLGIPTPCAENWEDMLPAERGRHCRHCCKTVVDFTAMSDEEIFRYIAAGPANICGRLMPDQLGRRLEPAPVKRNGWTGWRWVVASVLLVAKGAEPGRPMRPPVQQSPVKADTDEVVKSRVMGEVAPKTDFRRPSVLGDTVITVKKETAVDGMLLVLPEKPDTTMLQPTIQPPPPKELVGYTGGISVCWKRIDTVADLLKRAVVDTLTALRLFPKDELNIYPNPVVRGGALQLDWQGEPGKYQVTLLNIRGALVEQRLLDVAGKGQVDQWSLPAGLAAGVYMLRVVREGGADVLVRELMVR